MARRVPSHDPKSRGRQQRLQLDLHEKPVVLSLHATGPSLERPDTALVKGVVGRTEEEVTTR
jgi:hypothetical protein